jgi:hypothetical protein
MPLCPQCHVQFHGACGPFSDMKQAERRDWQNRMVDRYRAQYGALLKQEEHGRDVLINNPLEDDYRNILESAQRAGFDTKHPVVQAALLDSYGRAWMVSWMPLAERVLDEVRRWRPRGER